MRKEVMVRITFSVVILILLILVVFAKDIMAAVTETMTETIEEQSGSMMDQLLR